VSYCYAVQNKRRLAGLDKVHFFTTINQQNTLIKAKSWPRGPRNAQRNCAVRSCPILCRGRLRNSVARCWLKKQPNLFIKHAQNQPKNSKLAQIIAQNLR